MARCTQAAHGPPGRGNVHRQDFLQDAIQAALLAGFDLGDIDVMGDFDSVCERFGAFYMPPEEIAEVPLPRPACIARGRSSKAISLWPTADNQYVKLTTVRAGRRLFGKTLHMARQ